MYFSIFLEKRTEQLLHHSLEPILLVLIVDVDNTAFLGVKGVECACAPEELHQKMRKSDHYRSGVVQGHLIPVAGVF